MNKTSNDETDEVLKTAVDINTKRRPIYQLLYRHLIAMCVFLYTYYDFIKFIVSDVWRSFCRH